MEFHDPVLGTLREAEEGCWEAAVTLGGTSFLFKIDGDSKPDPALIEHACEIVRTFPRFNQMISEFLRSEARRKPGAAEEIHQLVTEDLVLYSSARLVRGMIYFKGPDKYRLWRCDYVNGRPQALTFDD